MITEEIPFKYIYHGDRLTDPSLKKKICYAVRKDKCIRGKNGSMLVVFESGETHVIIGKLLRKWKRK